MPRTLSWRESREEWMAILERRTGLGVAEWNQRIRAQALEDEAGLRAWLEAQGVTGYAQSLLVMERFGYPDFLLASAEELIAAQYADRPELQPILEEIIAATSGFDGVTVQARKTYVSLVAPRRIFARVQPTTPARVDLCLRLLGQRPTGRLRVSRIHALMPVQIGLAGRREVDTEVRSWLLRAYHENS